MNSLDMCRSSVWMCSLWPCRRGSWTLSCPRRKPDWHIIRKSSRRRRKPCRTSIQPSKNIKQVCYDRVASSTFGSTNGVGGRRKVEREWGCLETSLLLRFHYRAQKLAVALMRGFLVSWRNSHFPLRANPLFLLKVWYLLIVLILV